MGGAGGRGKSPSPFLPGWQVSYSLPWHLLGGWTFQRFRQQGSLSLASPPSGWMPLTSLGHWMSLPQHWLPPWSPPSSYCPLCPLPVPSILILSPPSSSCPLQPFPPPSREPLWTDFPAAPGTHFWAWVPHGSSTHTQAGASPRQHSCALRGSAPKAVCGLLCHPRRSWMGQCPVDFPRQPPTDPLSRVAMPQPLHPDL